MLTTMRKSYAFVKCSDCETSRSWVLKITLEQICNLVSETFDIVSKIKQKKKRRESLKPVFKLTCCLLNLFFVEIKTLFLRTNFSNLKRLVSGYFSGKKWYYSKNGIDDSIITKCYSMNAFNKLQSRGITYRILQVVTDLTLQH